MKFKREKRVYNPRHPRRQIILWHVWQPHGWLQTVDEGSCRDKVHDQFGVAFHQCSRKPKKTIGGFGFCTQHAKQLEEQLKAEGYLTPKR